MAAATDPDDAGGWPADYEVPEWLSLDDDEETWWVGEPVPVSIVGTAVWGLLLGVFLVGLLILLTLPLSWLSIKNTDYVITNKALYVKQGVLNATSRASASTRSRTRSTADRSGARSSTSRAST